MASTVSEWPIVDIPSGGLVKLRETGLILAGQTFAAAGDGLLSAGVERTLLRDG